MSKQQHYTGSKLHKLVHKVCDLLNKNGAEPADGLFVAANLLSNAVEFYGDARAREILETAFRIMREQRDNEKSIAE